MRWHASQQAKASEIVLQLFVKMNTKEKAFEGIFYIV